MFARRWTRIFVLTQGEKTDVLVPEGYALYVRVRL